jgi:hypothetical protein
MDDKYMVAMIREGDLFQIVLTDEQLTVLRVFLSAMSKETPLVMNPEPICKVKVERRGGEDDSKG